MSSNQSAIKLKKLADQGDMAAMHEIGCIFFYGTGVAIDRRKSAQWFLKAAELGYVPAQLDLGRQFLTGDGVPQDNIKAQHWLEMAAEQGVQEARFLLSLLKDSESPLGPDTRKREEIDISSQNIQVVVAPYKSVVTNVFKRRGKPVKQGEVLFELKTKKRTIRPRSPGDGVLSDILVEVGQEVSKGTDLALVNTLSDENPSFSSPTEPRLSTSEPVQVEKKILQIVRVPDESTLIGEPPFTVTDLFCKIGETVKKDQELLIYENDRGACYIDATVPGTILNIYVKEGDLIKVGDLLIRINSQNDKAVEIRLPRNSRFFESDDARISSDYFEVLGGLQIGNSIYPGERLISLGSRQWDGEVLSPYAGCIVNIDVNQGDLVTFGDPLVTLAPIQSHIKDDPQHFFSESLEVEDLPVDKTLSLMAFQFGWTGDQLKAIKSAFLNKENQATHDLLRIRDVLVGEWVYQKKYDSVGSGKYLMTAELYSTYSFSKNGEYRSYEETKFLEGFEQSLKKIDIDEIEGRWLLVGHDEFLIIPQRGAQVTVKPFKLLQDFQLRIGKKEVDPRNDRIYMRLDR